MAARRVLVRLVPAVGREVVLGLAHRTTHHGVRAQQIGCQILEYITLPASDRVRQKSLTHILSTWVGAGAVPIALPPPGFYTVA